MKSFHAKHWQEKPFYKPINCCNPWRELLTNPFAENSVVLIVDVNSTSSIIAVCIIDNQGRPKDLKIEPTHWMELGDICRPGGRKCRWVSPQEKEERDFGRTVFTKQSFYKFCKSIIIYSTFSLLLLTGVYWFGTIYLYMSTKYPILPSMTSRFHFIPDRYSRY